MPESKIQSEKQSVENKRSLKIYFVCFFNSGRVCSENKLVGSSSCPPGPPARSAELRGRAEVGGGGRHEARGEAPLPSLFSQRYYLIKKLLKQSGHLGRGVVYSAPRSLYP